MPFRTVRKGFFADINAVARNSSTEFDSGYIKWEERKYMVNS